MEASEKRKKNKCCVPGCKDVASKRHRFPKDPVWCKRWVENIKSSALYDLTPDKIYWTYYVCDIHFAREYIVPGTLRGLRKDAIPTLHLSVLSEEVEVVVEERQAVCSSESNTLRRAPQASTSGTEVVEEVQAKAKVVQDERFVSSCQPSTSLVQERPSVASQPSSSSATMQGQPLSACHESEAHQGSMVSPVMCKMMAHFSTQTPKKRRGILQAVSITRQRDLTPRCKKFYQMVGKWGQRTAALQHKVKLFKQRLRAAEKVAQCTNFTNLMDSVNDTTYKFIVQQVRTQRLAPRGRRFTLDEKILALSLLKASAKGYTLLAKIFSLPSPRTLTNLLNSVPYGAGINKQIFNSLRVAVKNLKKDNDRLCAVVFDELSLKPLLAVNRRLDLIEGFEDCGNGKRTGQIADYANVFMVKGIHRQWKQALSFTFSSGPVKSKVLKQQLVQVIKECQKIGLEVVATVCDQGGANQAVINALLKETADQCTRNGVDNSYSGFVVNGYDIIPLFDVPHLFKGIRNNLLTKDAHFVQNGVKKIASWKHIELFYCLDKLENIRLCPKLTDGHIFIQKMNKMKVKLMAQVFSHTVGALLKRISQWDTKSEYNLPSEAAATGDFILFMDLLFDSLNGNTKNITVSKPLKGGVTTSSGHEEFWREAIDVLQQMRFYNTSKKQLVKIPSCVNLIKTLKGFIQLKRKLLSKMQYILPRAINQDCLENFFASLRGHGRYNMLPDVAHFVTSFKALLVNNFFSSHSPGANCENDSTVGALDNLRSFLTGEELAGVASIDADIALDVTDVPQHFKKTRVAKATLAYIAGYVGKRILKMYGHCEECKQSLLASHGDVPCEVIEAREYLGARLTRPGSYLYYVTSQAASILFHFLPRNCFRPNIGTLLRNIINTHVNLTPLHCSAHKDLEVSVAKLVTHIILYSWIKQVNLVLVGKDDGFQLILKKTSDTRLVDPIKLLAHKKYVKKQPIRKRM